MKKTHLLTACLAVSLTAQAAIPDEFVDAFGDTFEPPAIAEAVKTDGAITLDGNADEAAWGNAPEYSLEGHGWPIPDGAGWEEVYTTPLPEPFDLSATYKAVWDDEFLYLYVEVNDDILVRDSDTVIDDDGLEVYFDGDNSRDIGTAFNDPGQDFVNDWHKMVKADESTPFTGGLYDPTEEGTVEVEQPLTIERGFQETLDGWSMELKLNFSGIFRSFFADGSLVQPVEAGTYFGFEIKVIDDDDGGGRDVAIVWGVANNNHYANPSINPVMVLTEDGGPPEPVSLWEELAADPETGAKEAGIGFLDDSAYPWVYSYNLSAYMFVIDAFSPSKDSAIAYLPGTGQWIWLNDSWGWYFDFNSNAWNQF